MTKAEMAIEKPVVKMVRFEAENTMRLKAFDVEFDTEQNVFVIAGENAQGKSSAINAMAMTLGGARLDPPKVIREGADEAMTRMTLSDGYVLQVEWKNGAARKLEVLAPDGVIQTSPQTWLASKIGKYTIDPGGLLSLKDTALQTEVERALGLDFSKLNEEREEKYNERTIVGREVDRLKARLTALPKIPDNEEPPVDLTALLAEQDRLQVIQRENDRLASVVREATTKRMGAVSEYKSTEAALEQSRASLKAAEAEVARMKQQVADSELRLGALESKGKSLTAELKAAEKSASEGEDVALSLGDVRAKLEAANAMSEANALASAKQKERETLIVESKEKAHEHTALTKRIDDIDDEKARQLAAAKFPVPGMSFSMSGLLLNGRAFSQASQAERLRLVVALGAISKPELRLLFVRDGSLLDTNSMKLLGELAREYDAQVIVEAVGKHRPGPAIIIEDGSVTEVRT